MIFHKKLEPILLLFILSKATSDMMTSFGTFRPYFSLSTNSVTKGNLREEIRTDNVHFTLDTVSEYEEVKKNYWTKRKPLQKIDGFFDKIDPNL